MERIVCQVVFRGLIKVFAAASAVAGTSFLGSELQGLAKVSRGFFHNIKRLPVRQSRLNLLIMQFFFYLLG